MSVGGSATLRANSTIDLFIGVLLSRELFQFKVFFSHRVTDTGLS